MISLEHKFNGKAYAFYAQGAGKSRVKAAAVEAQRLALRDYVLQRQPDRFKADAFAKYGFAERSKAYQKRQKRDPTLMRVVPFVSPRRSVEWALNMLKKIAELQSQGTVSGQMTAIAARANDALRNAGRPHMRDAVKIPGSGYNITGNKTVQLKQPAARPLNAKPFYLNEFRDLNRGGDLGWIRKRAAFHFERIMRRGKAA